MLDFSAHWLRTLLLGAFCILAGSRLDAALLETFPDQQTLGPHADVFSDLDSIVYDATSDTMTIEGRPVNFLDDNGTSYNDFENPPVPVFSITANIDSLGAIGAGGGSLSISGIITSLGNANPTLLTGSLEEFGFANPFSGGADFQLVFGSLTGELAPFFHGGKAYVQVAAVDFGTTFNGTFTQDFNFIGDRATALAADTFGLPAPEPSSAHLLVLALGGFTGVYRRKIRFQRVN